jgi:DNA-binding response OmpR family regulator
MNMNKKILLLDGENDILSLAHEIMFYGYSDLHFTADAAAVYDIAVAYKPDLIILDMSLIANGFEDLRTRLRSISGLENVPMIAVSSYYNRVINNSNTDAETVFIKPFDNKEFADKISYLMAS